MRCYQDFIFKKQMILRRKLTTHGVTAAIKSQASIHKYTLPRKPESKSPGRRLQLLGFAIERPRRYRKPRLFIDLLCPPPSTRHHQRLHLRPRLVLQLQQASQTSRPRPFLDVFPTSPHIPHFPARFSRLHKGKSHLGSDGLVVAYSYAHQEPDLSEDKNDRQEAVATIFRSKPGSNQEKGVRICMENGSQWCASRLPSGSYDFVMDDGQSQRRASRWVPKQKSVGRQRAIEGTESVETPEAIFSFSVLDPTIRRHAIIATLTPQGIEISDQYCNPPPLIQSSSGQSHSYDSDQATPQNKYGSPERIMKTVDNDLRLFITVSGVWVALAEGFWQTPGHDSKDVKLRELEDGGGKGSGRLSLEAGSPHMRSKGSRNGSENDSVGAQSATKPSKPSSANGQTKHGRALTDRNVIEQNKPTRIRTSTATSRRDPIPMLKCERSKKADEQPELTPNIVSTQGQSASELKPWSRSRSQGALDSKISERPKTLAYQTGSHDITAERKGFLRTFGLHTRRHHDE